MWTTPVYIHKQQICFDADWCSCVFAHISQKRWCSTCETAVTKMGDSDRRDTENQSPVSCLSGWIDQLDHDVPPQCRHLHALRNRRAEDAAEWSTKIQGRVPLGFVSKGSEVHLGIDQGAWRQGSHTCRVWEAHFAQLHANGREKKTFSLGQSRTWTR